MRTVPGLAWRNVWRNRRRSLITMSAVVFSVLLIAITRSLQYGSYDAMESQAVRLFTGEIQVQRAGYRDEQTFEYALDGEDAWQEAVSAAPFVTGAARRLTGFGLASSESSSAGVLVVGVEPALEASVTDFSDRLEDGAPLDAGSHGEALLGRVLARNLGVALGDTVIVLTQGLHNQMGAEAFRIRGLLKTGSLEMDRSTMVITLPSAQLLFSMEGRFTEVVLATEDFRRAADYARRIEHSLPGDGIRVYDWDTLMPELRQMILLDNVSGAIMLAFLLVLVGFEIFNTTTMAVLEREREFGVLQALGMRPGHLARLVATELAFKIALALAVAMTACGLLLWYLEGHPIPLSDDLARMYEEYGFSVDTLVFSTRPAVFFEPVLSVAGIALLSAVYPVVRVLRLETVVALRRGT